MILIIPEHLSKSICSKLIQLFNRNEKIYQDWSCTNPIELIQLENDIDIFLTKKVVKYVSDTIKSVFGQGIYVECAQIVRWNKGCFQSSHTDDAREYTCLASITYLNDDFFGGKTILNESELSVKPEIGKTFVFDGKKYNHSVSKNIGAERYTLALWYTKNIEEAIKKFL
jgi:hypothetical protein